MSDFESDFESGLAKMAVEGAGFAFAGVIDDCRRKEEECQPGLRVTCFPYSHSEDPKPPILDHAQKSKEYDF